MSKTLTRSELFSAMADGKEIEYSLGDKWQPFKYLNVQSCITVDHDYQYRLKEPKIEKPELLGKTIYDTKEEIYFIIFYYYIDAKGETKVYMPYRKDLTIKEIKENKRYVILY